MTHPCKNKCSEYKDEPCKNCLIQEPEVIDLVETLNQILDELEDGENHHA